MRHAEVVTQYPLLAHRFEKGRRKAISNEQVKYKLGLVDEIDHKSAGHIPVMFGVEKNVLLFVDLTNQRRKKKTKKIL